MGMHQSLTKSQAFSLIGVVFIGHFFVDLMLSIWPVYKTMADLDLAKAGIISGICALIGEGSQMFFGPIGDRGHYRRIAGIGVILSAASTLFVYSQSYFVLFLMFLSTYLGSGAFHPTGLGFVGAAVPPKSRRIFVSAFVMAGALGMAFGQIVFSQVYYLFEGETVILALPVLISGGLLLFPKSSAELEMSQQRKAQKHTSFRDVFGFFKDRDLRCLYVVQICTQALLWVIIFLLPDVLSTREYANWMSFGGGHMAFILGFGMIMIPMGYLAQKVSSRALVLSAMFTGTLSIYAFLAYPYLGNSLTLTLLFLVGAAIGTISPLTLALGQHMVPDRPGAVSAFLMGMAWCVAECIGPTGGGILTKFFVEDAPAKALAIMSSLFIIGFMAMYRFREPPQEPLEIR